MKIFYLLIGSCFLLQALCAQEPSSRICIPCVGGGGGGQPPPSCSGFSALFVDANKAGASGDGKTWATAFKTLQEALIINSHCTVVRTILIAKGVYKPTTDNNRSSTFFIGNAVTLRGGYAPGGSDDPDPAAYPTILDGDIGTAGVSTDNSYHVMVVGGFTGDVTIEGLQIRNGYANGAGDINLYDNVYLPQFQAAGLYMTEDVNGTLTIRNCAFSNNTATGAGGAITSTTGTVNIDQCVFYNNSSDLGDVMWNYAGSFTVNKSTIHSAKANSVTGNVAFSNSIIWGHNNLLAAAGITTQYCIVQGGRAGTGIIDENPQFANPATGDLRLKSCSPAINRGNNEIAGNDPTDMAGNTRIYDNNIDIGAYEYSLPVAPSGASSLAVNGEATQTFVYGGSTVLTNNCHMIASILPNGVSPVNGDISAKAFVENGVPEYNGKFYVARHYDITHTTHSKATGRVTLYFTQEDFDNYNTAVGTKRDHLPANSTDDANKATLRVNQFHGTSQNGNGLPSSYTGTFSFIDPDDADIQWHTGRGFDPGYWTVSFNVTGFSGFFITAGVNSTLPVEWEDFTAVLFQEKVRLNWQTVSEQNSSHFIVERSLNGIDFETAGHVNATGVSNSLQQYTWIDDIASTLNSTIFYYRLQQVDQDGKHNYSKVVQIKIEKKSWVSSVVNPISNTIHVNVFAENPGVLSSKLVDIQGRIILKKSQLLTRGVNTIQLPATHLSKGIYLLELVQGGKTSVKKLVKD